MIKTMKTLETLQNELIKNLQHSIRIIEIAQGKKSKSFTAIRAVNKELSKMESSISKMV